MGHGAIINDVLEGQPGEWMKKSFCSFAHSPATTAAKAATVVGDSKTFDTSWREENSSIQREFPSFEKGGRGNVDNSEAREGFGAGLCWGSGTAKTLKVCHPLQKVAEGTWQPPPQYQDRPLTTFTGDIGSSWSRYPNQWQSLRMSFFGQQHHMHRETQSFHFLTVVTLTFWATYFWYSWSNNSLMYLTPFLRESHFSCPSTVYTYIKSCFKCTTS